MKSSNPSTAFGPSWALNKACGSIALRVPLGSHPKPQLTRFRLSHEAERTPAELLPAEARCEAMELHPVLIHKEEASGRVFVRPAFQDAAVINFRDEVGKSRIEVPQRPACFLVQLFNANGILSSGSSQ